MENMESDYLKYRGKCKGLCEELVSENSGMQLIRGYYHDALWGKQTHWWCRDKNGNIIDPTKNQFPTKGNGEYEEFDGKVSCAECGREMLEHEAFYESRYAFCKDTYCHMKFVGLEEYIPKTKVHALNKSKMPNGEGEV